MSTENKKPKVVYIGGYGRSGSTLLDSILGNHPEMFGGGELETFFDDLAAGGTCTCGQSYEKCPFWTDVLNKLYARFPDLDPAAVGRERAHIETTLGRFNIYHHNSDVDEKRYGAVWQTFFQAISDVSGNPIIVDSSKSSRGNSRRIYALHKYAGLDIQVLHLIRDPRAVVYSEWGRGHNDRLEYNMGRRSTIGGMVRPMAGWAMANLAVSLTATHDKSIPVHRIHYEGLALETIPTLEEIGTFLGVDMSHIVDLIHNNGSIEAGHGVRGNRMRRQGTIKMKFDTEWIDAMPRAARLGIRSLWPVARHYDYDVRHWPTSLSYLSAMMTSEQAGKA